jgi:hypothetical protein
MKVDNFRPIASLNIVTGIASATTKLPGPGTGVRVANVDTAIIIYIAFGKAGVVATVNSIAILPGTVEVFSIAADPALALVTGDGTGDTHIACIAASGTPSLNVVTGEGA